MFSDEEIVDELIDFQGAGTMTTRNAIVTLVNHLANRPDVRSKIRDELKSHIDMSGSREE